MWDIILLTEIGGISFFCIYFVLEKLFFCGSGIEPKALNILGECSPTEVHCRPQLWV
jgi:hypothetical protein